MKPKLIRWTAAAALAIAAAAPAVAPAQEHFHGGPRGHFDHGPGPWRGDIGRFHEHDWGVWRGGNWMHARHDGRWGWWWVVGPTWYFYPSPVYPYPNPYEPPPVEMVTPPTNAAPAPPTPRSWYYCDPAKGYYPYVPTCPSGWREVPATPEAEQQPAQPPQPQPPPQ